MGAASEQEARQAGVGEASYLLRERKHRQGRARWQSEPTSAPHTGPIDESGHSSPPSPPIEPHFVH